MLASLLLLALGWGGAVAYQSWRIADIETTARQVAAAEPAVQGYPIELRYDEEADRLRVGGLVSDVEARDALDRALAAALPGIQAQLQLKYLPSGEIVRLAKGYEEIAGRLEVMEAAALRLESSLAGAVTSIDGQTKVLRQRTGELEGLAGDLEGTVKSLDAQRSQFENKARDLEGLASGLEASIDTVSHGPSGRLEQQTGSLQNMADNFEASVDAWSQSLGTRLDQLDRRLAAVEMAGPAPLDELQDWTARHSVFFGEETNLKWPDKAEAKLRDLATLLLAAPSEWHLRVVGYSDTLGSLAENHKISTARAGAVTERLRALDVPAERMVPVGRGAERPLTGTTGRDSANRRVEFELVFSGVR